MGHWMISDQFSCQGQLAKLKKEKPNLMFECIGVTKTIGCKEPTFCRAESGGEKTHFTSPTLMLYFFEILNKPKTTYLIYSTVYLQ